MADPGAGGRSGPIVATVETLGGLFAVPGRRFHFPHFQRAYAWGTDQVNRLLTNLLETAALPPARRRYFLGRLLLARPAGASDIAVVDGHQRLITLTILFAVLRDLAASPAEQDALHGLIADTGRGAANWHVQPAPSLAAFFAESVQRPGATAVAFDGDIAALSESQANVVTNRDVLRARLSDQELDPALRVALAEFLIHACRVIVHEVQDELEAWTMLQTEEQTRLDFNPTDEARASMLSVMSAADRELCGAVWERWQAAIGAEDMHGLLGHIDMLSRRRQTDMPVETELIRHFDLTAKGPQFFDTVFEAHARRLLQLRGRSGEGAAPAPAVAASIELASWISSQLWVPAALRWLETRGERDAATALFFKRLERLVWLLRISGTDPYVQRNRIIAVLGGIDSGAAVDEIKALAIDRRVRRDALTNLSSPTFYAKHYCGHILRRLSTLLDRDPGPVAPGKLTIEHVLPRNPPEGSGWMRAFRTRADVHAYANRLGNLTLLSEKRNQEAANTDWPTKRVVFAKEPAQVLSMQAAQEPEWTKATIDKRTTRLISVLFLDWELGEP